MPQVVFVEMPRKRRWPWVLGIFGLLSLICCGVCAAIAAPIAKQYPSTIAGMPRQVAGLDIKDDPIVKAIVAEAEHRIRTEEDVDDAFAGAYTDGGRDEKLVIVFGGTKLFLDPSGDMDRAIKSAGRDLTQVTEFDAGALGGELRCGDGVDDEGKQVVICAWLDHGSIGVGVFYGGRSKADSATFLRTLREAIIVRP